MDENKDPVPKRDILRNFVFVFAAVSVVCLLAFAYYTGGTKLSQCIDEHGGKVEITKVREIERSFWGEKCLYETTEGSRVLDCYYEVGDKVPPKECGILWVG